MTFKPADPDEFFQTLGADRVRKALVNGEVKGETKKAAQEWLNQYGATRTRFLAAGGLWITGIGIVIAGAVAIGVAIVQAG